MKKKHILLIVLLVVLLIFFGIFFYSHCNGLVFIDGKFVANIHLDYSDDTEQVLIPVVETLTHMGYSKISDTPAVIKLQKDDQILTLNLYKHYLDCPQFPFNCLDPLLENVQRVSIRKGTDVFVDASTFSGMLACIDCKYVITLANPKLRIVKLAYSDESTYSQLLRERVETILEDARKAELETIPEDVPEEEPIDVIMEARLIVNGLDITEGNHVYIHHGYKNAEIPMLAILRALGYDAKMQYDEKQDIYESVIGDQIGFFSTKYEDFNSPFSIGEKGCVRKIVNNDFIIDSNCVFTALYWFFGGEITVDYDNSIVYVDSCDPWAQ